jgi:hypothetical protein
MWQPAMHGQLVEVAPGVIGMERSKLVTKLNGIKE